MEDRSLAHASHLLEWIPSLAVLCCTAGASDSLACPVEPTASQEISISLGIGRSATVRTSIYPGPEQGSFCQASVEIPLSAFPTARVAMRPSDVARSMHDVVKQLGVEECAIVVWLENDTHEEIAEHELCLMQSFAFGERRFWSRTDEEYCWEPAQTGLLDGEGLASNP